MLGTFLVLMVVYYILLKFHFSVLSSYSSPTKIVLYFTKDCELWKRGRNPNILRRILEQSLLSTKGLAFFVTNNEEREREEKSSIIHYNGYLFWIFRELHISIFWRKTKTGRMHRACSFSRTMLRGTQNSWSCSPTNVVITSYLISRNEKKSICRALWICTYAINTNIQTARQIA